MIYRIINAFKRRFKYFYRSHANESKYSSFVMKDWIEMGGKPFDLNNPKTYCQKTQWAKIYDKDPRKTTHTDKVAVRDWVKDTVGEEYLVPIVGVYTNPEDIDFSSLPNQYVIKMNHSSHMNIIV